MGKRKLKWLEGYSGQTTDELIALETEYRTDSIVLAFEQALDQKGDRVGRDGLSKEELVILAIAALERKVNNGGYQQFFANPSNVYVPVVVDALNRLECKVAADLTKEAIDSLGIDKLITVAAIDNAMEAENEVRDNRLADCDDRYYETVGDLADPLLGFIKKNRERIVLEVSPQRGKASESTPYND